MKFHKIDIDKYEGNIDDIVVMDEGKPDSAMVLLGWDEIGTYDSWFKNPIYAEMED